MGGPGGGAEGLPDTGGPGPGGMPPGLAKKGGPEQGAMAQGQSQTSSRPAQEAATFAEAFTEDAGAVVSNLVMPKTAEPQLPPGQAKKTAERPAFQGNNAPTTAEAPDVPEGFSARDTESSRGNTRIFRMPDRNQGRGPENRKGPERSDNFGSTAPNTNTRIAMRASQVRAPVRPVKDLIPPNLDKLATMEAVAKRFGSDLALLQQQVRPSDSPARERALRAWAFFTAYAEAAAGKNGLQQALELFNKALKKEGFGELRDARTGQDAIKLALWVLEAATPEEALARALEADIEPMVALEVLLSEAAKTLEGKDGKGKAEKGKEASEKPDAGKGKEASQKADSGKAEDGRKAQEGRVSQPKQQVEVKPQETPRKPEEGRVSQPKSQASGATDNSFAQGLENASLERADSPGEQPRMNPQAPNAQQPVLLPPQPELTKRKTVEEESLIGKFEESMKKVDKGMRLGSNMLWNALHQLRKGPGDSAIEKEKWNQLAFAAMLAFVGLMLLVILVVAL
ncbi:MAG TPA: hypothetical protein VNA24_24440 [Hyalangium sp.]|nr:hypothetical protein [Hyalangium sp.]